MPIFFEKATLRLLDLWLEEVPIAGHKVRQP